MAPLVSIIIPAYNCEGTIAQSIESALKQTLSSLEIIVIDDCSTDGTYAVVEQIVSKEGRVFLYRNLEILVLPTPVILDATMLEANILHF